MLQDLALVGCGGAIGAVVRFLLSGVVSHSVQLGRFPIGTLVVNLLGCFLVGVFWGWSERFGLTSAHWRYFLVTGVLGGFTTFSAFGADSLELLRRQDWGLCATYVLASVCFGVAFASLGFVLLRR